MSGTLPSGADDDGDADGSPAADGGTAAGAVDAARHADAVDAESADGAERTDAADATDRPGDADRSADGDTGVRVCWLDDEDAGDVIGALGPETARAILSAVHEEPRTASELADCADTSVQNVRHHVSKLEDAELVAATDTRYSVKGREMTVYGPADDPVVVALGDDGERSSLLDSLRGLLGAAAVLAGASLLVQSLFGAGVATTSGPATAPRVGDAVSTTGGAALGTLSPGAAFLAGGVLVLVTVLAADRLRGR
ncbi:winged helix-turn-helix domain-containing protein [Halobaculum sp. CBA1158]|uniref:ArsR/SmtB family transcription factor n=1 Tax=Halobaculum sp. CBA1158 TaxID=2904243 RepID=UPI001F30C997|nr:winged helix-turn-helix domain-containing protein [Halobaculum sp. CBA1158]UIO99112.1 winged helix-turn-helix domain-containing protein [Halobaculum sp. CBA1158]